MKSTPAEEFENQMDEKEHSTRRIALFIIVRQLLFVGYEQRGGGRHVTKLGAPTLCSVKNFID